MSNDSARSGEDLSTEIREWQSKKEIARDIAEVVDDFDPTFYGSRSRLWLDKDDLEALQEWILDHEDTINESENDG